MKRIAKPIVQKIIDAHTVCVAGGRTLLYVDRVIAADTALPVFNSLSADGHRIRRPAQALLIPDHYTATTGPMLDDVVDEEKRELIAATQKTAQEFGIKAFSVGDVRRGIQHVVSAEQGFAQPGISLVAVDSHTSTQGAVGALAFSVSADLAHVLATQCVWFKPPGMMSVKIEGHLASGVTVKDVALVLVAKIGSAGASGFAIEYSGRWTKRLSIEARATLCNMSVEMGARLGIVAPDEKTIEYLHGRPFAPSEHHWDRAVDYWNTLPSDSDAVYDREVNLDVSEIQPMVTWGNNAENSVPITGVVPSPSDEPDPFRRAAMESSLEYMGLRPATQLTDISIDRVFIGSCANSRIEDLRAAADVMRGRKVVVPTSVIPGSGLVKTQAEAEGLDAVFRSAGADWGEAGCSMCVSMNGDSVPEGARCASTSNRNHMGRQGRGSRTHLVSPPTAAASAIFGRLSDVRKLEGH